MKIAILSDAHGNTPAFLTTIEEALRYEVSKFFHIGDLIGYVPNLEILDVIPSLNVEISFTRGNHEDLILRSIFSKEKDEVLNHRLISRIMKKEQREFLENFSPYIEHKTNSGIAHLSHGGPVSPIDGYIYEEDCEKLRHLDYAYIFVGNTHRPFKNKLGSKWIINVGSCGFPRDIGSKGSFALLDTCSGEVELIRFQIPNIEKIWTKKKLKNIHKSVLDNYYR